MKKLLSLMLATVMALSLVACGDTNVSTETGAASTETEVNEAATSLAVCLASEPGTLDPALNSAVDGATMVAHLFSGLAKWSQDADGNLVIVPDAATELVEGVTNEDGTVTYTYTLKDGLKWSDGQAVTAADFEFAWKRAASVELAADYGYMFEVVDGYADVWAEEPAEDAALNVTAVLAGILTSAPVCGFLPVLAALLEVANVPNPTSGTLSPLTNASVIEATIASTALPASAFVSPAFSATDSINSTFFIFLPPINL